MDSYIQILDKINALREKYPSLRTKPDYYVFSALCVEAHFYKNPENVLNESDFEAIIVDSCNDGGADIILSDPDSEICDLVIGQSKFYKRISKEDVINSLRKMVSFYNDMKAGHYEQVNSRVQSRFLTLNAETDEESKIHFVFYTSAKSSKKIDTENIKKQIIAQFTNPDAIEVSILFADDIIKEIETAKAIKQIVEHGKIQIDEKDNYLLYGDSAAIVNVSAFSLKDLYATHNITLLAHNLRYHISDSKIDKGMKNTIEKNPELFWLKNNGITIICDDFRIDGCEVHLRNFSIVNGGQTVYMLHKSKSLDKNNDFWLSCKIIKVEGITETEKNAFSLGIAQAANSQKPIKPADLRANAPEQRSFAQAMRAIGIFYQTKRGEKVPKEFSDSYKHTKLLDVGKLCLAAIFQLPCKSRSKPADFHNDNYYNPIFDEKTQKQIALICKELLYMDDYFTRKFLPKFDKENDDMPDASIRISFAHVARTICIAFTALAARYFHGNLSKEDIKLLLEKPSDDNACKKLRDIGDMKSLLPMKVYTDEYDATLDKLFTAIIEEGITIYSDAHDDDSSLTAANFLKKDDNYYKILRKRWAKLNKEIREIFISSK
ncbi:MAG: AIPR family protein [Selenomonadaceae bacterium]|nr:AIPR family protein [Selenomonadaceae bacterium]